MTFDYSEALRLVRVADKRPALSLRAFVPANGPVLSRAECVALAAETERSVDELERVFAVGPNGPSR